MSIGKIGSPHLQQWHALNTLKANFWRKVNMKKGLDSLKHWNQYQQFTHHLRKHHPHIQYLFEENPQRRVFQEDQYDEFKRNNNIIGLESITESDCPQGYLYTKYEGHVVFHKIILNELHVPEVTACTQVDDKLHVKLFLRGSTAPLQPWFRYGHNCKLTSKSMLENFTS